MRSSFITSFAIMAVLGCSGSGFDDQNDDNLDEAAKPQGGEFHAIVLPTSSTCGELDAELFDLAVIDVKLSKDGKQLDLTDGDLETPCTSDGKGGFACEAAQVVGKPPLEVTLTRKFSLRFATADRIEATFEIGSSCEGAECSEEVSCAIAGELIAVRTMPASFVPQTGAYHATVGKAILSTCEDELDVAAEQELDIQAGDDDKAIVIADGDTEHPFSCSFEGKGRATCSRETTGADGRELDAARRLFRSAPCRRWERGGVHGDDEPPLHRTRVPHRWHAVGATAATCTFRLPDEATRWTC